MTWTDLRLATCLLVFSLLGSFHEQQSPLFAQQLSIPPAFPRQEQKHHLPGVDEPPVVVRGDRRQPLNPAKTEAAGG